MWHWWLGYPFRGRQDRDYRLDLIDAMVWPTMYAVVCLGFDYLPPYRVEQVPDDRC